ncbi:hypothetical protein P691DRAFT_801234 [Macrolepiota fuliginosa MF-IS2]|uniref:Uncharacterized protein n=1 Tax=Macrolepiota fuliginosa MF-IS2 TaxID=1400762 RepID=A0A9P5XCI0_9AGAR|nr:hypothetical protein P691DRAFT_801234 [Macrolepiota fuliginosa MF-IS2]
MVSLARPLLSNNFANLYLLKHAIFNVPKNQGCDNSNCTCGDRWVIQASLRDFR